MCRKTHCSWILKAYFHEDRVQLEIVEVNFSHDTLFAESFLDLRNGTCLLLKLPLIAKIIMFTSSLVSTSKINYL